MSKGVAKSMDKLVPQTVPVAPLNPPLNQPVLPAPMQIPMQPTFNLGLVPNIPMQQNQFLPQFQIPMQQPIITEQPKVSTNLLSGLDPNQLARLLGRGHFGM